MSFLFFQILLLHYFHQSRSHRISLRLLWRSSKKNEFESTLFFQRQKINVFSFSNLDSNRKYAIISFDKNVDIANASLFCHIFNSDEKMKKKKSIKRFWKHIKKQSAREKKINKQKQYLIKQLSEEIQKKIYKKSKFWTDVTSRFSWIKTLKENQTNLTKQILQNQYFKHHHRFASFFSLIIIIKNVISSFISNFIRKIFLKLIVFSASIIEFFIIVKVISNFDFSNSITSQKRKKLTISKNFVSRSDHVRRANFYRKIDNNLFELFQNLNSTMKTTTNKKAKKAWIIIEKK